ncbi:MAG: FAD-binding protein [Bacillota bacterium]
MNPDRMAPVLVVGAGGAGLIAAAVAARAGAHVTVLSKAPPGMGNCTTYAGGGFTLGVGGVTPERHRELTAQTGRGLNVPEMLDALAFGSPEAVPGLADFGVPIQVRRGGAFVRSRLPERGLTGGTGLTLPLVDHCRQAGVEFDDRFFASSVAVEDGRAVGLVGVDLRTGQAVFRPASAVVLATGGAGRLYGRTDNPVRTTGDGYVMAFRAGLQLIDMEFVQFYPLGFAEPGGPIWMIGLEITDKVPVTNSDGVPFIERLLPKWGLKSGREANLFARDRAAIAVAAEWAEGRQVFLHLETLSEEDWKDPYFAALGRFYPAGFDRAKRPVRVAPVEHYFTGGIRLDDQGRTAIPGLFACGEVTGGTDGASRIGGNALSQLAVFGARAGKGAAGFAAGAGPVAETAGHGHAAPAPETAADSVARLSETIETWRRNAGAGEGRPAGQGHAPAALRADLNTLADRRLGPLRDGGGLKTAAAELEEMAARVQALAVADNRQVLEALELENLILVGRMVTAAATTREESRGVHHRSDFPDESAAWLRHLGVTAGPKGQVVIEPCDAGTVGLPAGSDEPIKGARP